MRKDEDFLFFLFEFKNLREKVETPLSLFFGGLLNTKKQQKTF